MVITKDTGDKDAPLKATTTTPQGRELFLPTKKIPEGYECTFNPKEKGPHKINIEFAGKDVPESPFDVDVTAKFVIRNVQVKGLDTRELKFRKPCNNKVSKCPKNKMKFN